MPLPPPNDPTERKQYEAKARADWVRIIDAIPGAVGSATIAYTGLSSIVAVLKLFVGQGRNYLYFPTGGGLEIIDVSESTIEDGCVEFWVAKRKAYIGRPKVLQLERINSQPAESFLHLELVELPESGVYQNDPDESNQEKIINLDSEDLIFLNTGNYVSFEALNFGLSQSEDVPLPADHVVVNRMLRGNVLIVCKVCIWTSIRESAIGLHNKFGAKLLRQIIEDELSSRAG